MDTSKLVELKMQNTNDASTFLDSTLCCFCREGHIKHLVFSEVTVDGIYYNKIELHRCDKCGYTTGMKFNRYL